MAAEDYEKKCELVRKESSHLSDAEYKEQRLKILQLFLQIPNIFATESFREKYELKARHNIETEIERLSSS